jgi:hypothetical protein
MLGWYAMASCHILTLKHRHHSLGDYSVRHCLVEGRECYFSALQGD